MDILLLLLVVIKKVLNKLLQTISKLVNLLSRLLNKVYNDILNDSQPNVFFKDFALNISFVLLCIGSTIVLNYIPRPDHIYYKFLYRFDTYFFDLWSQPIGSLSGLCLTILGSIIIYSLYYNKQEEVINIAHFKLKPLQISSVLEYNDPASPISLTSSTIPSPDSSTFSPTTESNITDEEHILELETNKHQPKTLKDLWNLIPVLLLLFSWFLLNILYTFKYPINKPKNIIAWIFHVPVHFIVPPMIGSWLYLFHPPSSLKLFTFTLGLQNFALLLTYLIFPNVPPTYIKIYGDNKIPSFDMIFTDGAAIEDKKFSFLLHKGLYYASPYKFASFPSLHSSFACLIYFFVCHYSTWSSFKILGLINVLGQWWSDLYLDHHWRIDSLGGLIYAIITWTILKYYTNKLSDIDLKFSKAKLYGDFINGSTMGMRLFKNTRLQNLFDPEK
ncbi:unnamed protein product [Candida verbasci]|uniref:Inositolphosphotransferase Aur1/Ipt1 domain-containing protein n=1 Tax=Candida verbasci TaxID=1227364 RepID=A0A9W4TT66_9ASCO|nr:unnamed protein product [Candida verbasci]